MVEDPNSSYLYFIYYIFYFLKTQFSFSDLNFILQKKSEDSEVSENSEISGFFKKNTCDISSEKKASKWHRIKYGMKFEGYLLETKK